MKKHRYVILAILFSCTFINYIDRASLAVAAPYVMKEFNLTPSQMGVVFSGFFLSYSLFCFVGGYLSDIHGPKKTITVAMLVWSLFAGAPAIAWGFGSLIVFRILFGMGEGPVSAVVNKMINNWFPAGERAKAKGIADSGMSCGAAITGPIVAFMAIQFGWRISFVFLTILGIIWVFFWNRMVTDIPRNHPKVSLEEATEIEQGQVTVSQVSSSRPITYYFKQPIILSIIVAFFACNYITYFFLTWFPSYLVMAYNLSIQNMAIVNVIPWIGGIFGMVFGGFLSDSIYKRIGDLILSRKIVIIGCLGGAAIAIGLCGVVTTVVPAVALLSLGIFLTYLTLPCYWAIIQDSVRGENVGGVGGFVHFLSNTAGIIAPFVTGYIVEVTGQFTSAFYLTALLAILGAICVTLFAKPIKDDMAYEKLSV